MPIHKSPNHIFFLQILLLTVSYTTAQDSSTSPPPPYGFNPNFNPSMAIIIIVLISAFFFMGFFSIYIRQCAGERSDRPARPAIAGGVAARSRRAPKGLDPTVIETFPTFAYSAVKGLKIGKGALECAVCLNEFEDDETLRLLPKCDHVFHPECIDAWLCSHVTCPVCRANLVPEPVDTATAETSSAATHVPDSGSESDGGVEISISVDDDSSSTQTQQPDVINPSQIPFQNRPGRSKSIRTRLSGKFPRSHSTGHSLIQPGENCDRFTLRLPEDIRKKIVNGKLNRTTSCVSSPYGTGGGSRRGYRGGSLNEGSSKYNKFWPLDPAAKSDRWVFSMQPPFITRTASVRSPKGDNGEGSRGKRIMTSVKSFKNSMDCMSPKVDGDGDAQSSSRPPV